MASFDWKKNIEGSLRDGLIITSGAIKIFFRLKVANVCYGCYYGCYGYHETCPWNLWRVAGEILCILQKMDQQVIQQKFYDPIGS